MDEAAIDARLDAFVRGAREGDVAQARQMHEMLDAMLTEGDTPNGRLWLTGHGRMLLAGMHRELGRCEATGQGLADAVLEAVRLKPHPHHWDDTCSFIRDLRLAITVANEMCEQREASGEADLARAAEVVAKRGEFGSDPAHIRAVYDEIAATVTGFRRIANC
jgi:hypothetical protein